MTKHKIIIGDAENVMKKRIADDSIQLIITSPPYAHIKDYGIEGQIGFGNSFREYINELAKVWKECFRVLQPNCRLIINVGDVYNTTPVLGRHKALPIHAHFIIKCEEIGFDYMGHIIWQKKGTVNPSGGANVMGSFPYPRNGIVEYDYEYILIFKKLGKGNGLEFPETFKIKENLKKKGITKQQWIKRVKEKSALSLKEWRELFAGHWRFPGIRQKEHLAMFPDELPRRLIKMFSFAALPELGFAGDTVLDPFLGSGTTMKVAKELNRNSVGIELNPKFLEIIKRKVGVNQKTLNLNLDENCEFEIVFG
ncbi:MAG: site-specific DNA-methyltransferase [Methanophagales archaeon]|nr:site-specific DNA-methyltransferase [Methanophagales archaeon]